MCLKIHNIPERLKAEEDIICYKSLIGPTPSLIDMEVEDHSYWSIFHSYQYKIGQKYFTLLGYPTFHNRSAIINKGFHSWDKTKLKKIGTFYKTNGYAFVECVIPKGSMYYRGWQNAGFDGCEVPGYVSDSIVIKRPLTYKDIKNLSK